MRNIEEEGDSDHMDQVGIHGLSMQCCQDFSQLLIGEVGEEDLGGVVECVGVEG